MRSKETILLTNRYSDEILDVIDHREEFTRNDLQGIVEALVTRILKEAGTN